MRGSRRLPLFPIFRSFLVKRRQRVSITALVPFSPTARALAAVVTMSRDSSSGLAAVRDPSGAQTSAASLDYGPKVAEHRQFFSSGKPAEMAYRRRQLQALRKMLAEHLDDFAKAISTDLGRHTQMSLFSDCYTSMTAIDDALDNMDAWAKPRPQGGSLEFVGSSARLVPQGASVGRTSRGGRGGGAHHQSCMWGMGGHPV